MKIGLLSDTHSHLEKSILDHFKDCDELWHAGDIGEDTVLQQLQDFKPTKAVFGNIDSMKLQRSLAEDLWFECEGLQIWMTHIGGAPPNYNPRIKKKLKEAVPDIFICGHSHILRVMRDPHYANMLYINPGAAGNHGFHHMKTIMRFDIEAGAIKNVEVIELGKRGALPKP
ncbi:MAG: metallophosphoesterase [Cytophagia bacterium]|nr:metallophosphoesterase [Cytophagia bacterium]NBW35790.1 metallophosphoesterase [Cytophagia bacterium]